MLVRAAPGVWPWVVGLSPAAKAHCDRGVLSGHPSNQTLSRAPSNRLTVVAVSGNAGTIISFRVGTKDAPYLEKELNDSVEQNDIDDNRRMPSSISACNIEALRGTAGRLPSRPQRHAEFRCLLICRAWGSFQHACDSSCFLLFASERLEGSNVLVCPRPALRGFLCHSHLRITAYAKYEGR